MLRDVPPLDIKKDLIKKYRITNGNLCKDVKT